MFHKWGFLLSEIWGLLLLASLFGVLVGWIIWGRRPEVAVDTSAADRLRDDLAACNAKGSDLAARLAAAERAQADAEARAKEAAARAIANEASATVSAAASAATAPAPMAAMAAPVMAATSEPKGKPKGLTAARGGKADDLKQISGIGPKLEILCNTLGFYHFDQIAAWTKTEIAWVDENLEGFKGRVTRDEWVAQAKDLAAGKPSRLKASK